MDVGTSSSTLILCLEAQRTCPGVALTPVVSSLSFAMFLHIAILHNKYQITNRAMDALLWYCEPKHHTRAFCTSCCAVMSLPVYEKHYPGPVRVLWCPVAAWDDISVGVNLNQIKLNDTHKCYCRPFSQDLRGQQILQKTNEINTNIHSYTSIWGKMYSPGYVVYGTNFRN